MKLMEYAQINLFNLKRPLPFLDLRLYLDPTM